MTIRNQATTVSAFLALTLLLTGCAAESKTESAEGPNSTAPANPPAETTKPKDEPVVQEGTCDWDTGRLESGSANAPNSAAGELSIALIGAWQHTHIDSGATNKAARTVTISLGGVELILPSPATGYAVTAWDADTMVWENHRDGSRYLLKRR